MALPSGFEPDTHIIDSDASPPVQEHAAFVTTGQTGHPGRPGRKTEPPPST